ncbi:MAG: hypothetical protein KA072_05330 [Thermoanaerobaculaceae bacterium]|nr:hypothetical protein [Thermoanaerobaculaceae bacterium]MDI9622903.1 hypothetical protein [Acidobacteriota bacterium]NLH12090.1 hypothetical protein [Holophagae bacterium]
MAHSFLADFDVGSPCEVEGEWTLAIIRGRSRDEVADPTGLEAEQEAILLGTVESWIMFSRVASFGQLARRFEALPWPVPPDAVFPGLLLLRYDRRRRTVFHWIVGHEDDVSFLSTLSLVVRFLVMLWHLERKALTLHCSAVEWGGGAVALLARSGGGKSTFARLGADAGLRVLADDQAIVQLRRQNLIEIFGISNLAAREGRKWPRARLDAVVVLRKAQPSSVHPLGRLAVVQALLNSHAEAGPLDQLPLSMRVRGLDTARSIAGLVRGFELRFSPDREAVELLTRAVGMSVEGL